MDSGTRIDGERLAVLTGLSDRRLRQLAKEGFFPSPERGLYDLPKTISGLFRYYRESSQRLPIFDSLEQCAAATGIPRAVLKGAKQLGCEAFVSSRIRLDALLKFLFDPQRNKQESGTIQEFQKKKVAEESRLLELKRLKTEGDLLPIDDVRKEVQEMVYAFRVEILSLPGKLAPRVVGVSVPEAEIRIRDGVTEALMRLHREPWQTPP